MTRWIGCLCVVASLVLARGGVAHAQDADGDTIPDAIDVCPTTPPGLVVDGAGCDAFCEAVDVTTDVFLRSRLLEVGTAILGSFGSSADAPSGWHPRAGRAAAPVLGFVADPNRTDWTDFQGDFFVPGDPEEGWGLSIDGADYFDSTLQLVEGIPGGFTGSRAACRPMICGLRGGGSMQWAGGVDGILVDQTYSVLNEGLFILIEVTLRNTSAATHVVTYFRNVDPDNMVTLTTSYATDNTIVSQGDGTDTSLAHVSATTTAPDSYLALISQDPDARVIIGGFLNRSADDVWDCTGVGFQCAEGDMRSDDVAVALAVRKTLAPGDSVTFRFAYTLDVVSVVAASACTVATVCGDGMVEGVEVCDDGNTIDDDACTNACRAPTCGDGRMQMGETCDDGNVENDDACLATCVPATCGDGFVQSGVEECDDGNMVAGDGCTTCMTDEPDAGTMDAGPMEDAAVIEVDAARIDAGRDAAVRDAGPPELIVGGSGATCGCRAVGASHDGSVGAIVMFVVAGLVLARRRRRA